MSLTIRLPLPAPELSPNARPHWAVLAEAKAAARAEAKIQALNAKRAAGIVEPLAGRVTLDVLFVLKDNRRRDLQNMFASIKAHLDGIVDSGLLVDDDSKHLRLGSLQARKQQPLEPAAVYLKLTAEAEA